MNMPSTVQNIKVFNMFTYSKKYKIIWDANSNTEAVGQYNIYRSENSFNGFVLVGSVVYPPNLQFIDDTMAFTFDKVWYYKVTAVNASGESLIEKTQAVTDFDYTAFVKPPSITDIQSGLIEVDRYEIAQGMIDGVNTIFATLNNFKPGTVSVYIDGIKAYPGSYVELTPNSIQLNTPPASNSKISISYMLF